MVKINATQGVEFSAPTQSTSASEANNINISFSYSDNTEDIVNQANTAKSVKNTLRGNKKNIELHEPWIGSDYIIFKGNGKMTYGDLRQNLGIPPKVLSETNGKRLTDNQIVKETKIYLDDIGWYETTPMSAAEASDIRAQRRYGNNYAGYSKAISNKEIIKQLK
ncbi:unknown [Clostridium sp. CAG:768]|nr:unknown [Clostridium sp. CAG:768]